MLPRSSAPPDRSNPTKGRGCHVASGARTRGCTEGARGGGRAPLGAPSPIRRAQSPQHCPPTPRGRPRSPPTPGSLPPLTNGDGRDDEGVAEEESGGLGREVAAEILQQQILLRLLPPAGTAFGRHAWVQSALPKTGHRFRCVGSYFRCVGCYFRRARRHFRWWGAVAVPAVLAEAMLSARLLAAAGSRRAARSRAWSRLRGTRRKPALLRVLGPVASEYGSRVWGRSAPAERCSAGVR